jgi:hypothetical protein
MVVVYGDFSGFGRFWAAKNKANSKPILDETMFLVRKD